MASAVYSSYSSSVKSLKGDVDAVDAVNAAVEASTSSGSYIESPTIYGGTIDNTLIGGNTAADAYFLSLQTGSPGTGYNVSFYGDGSGAAVWQASKSIWSITGGLAVSGQSDLGNISIGGNSLQANDLNGNISILANGTGYVGVDRLPHLVLRNADHDAGWLIEWPDTSHPTQLGFFGVRPDGAFTYIPGATVMTDQMGRRAVTGDTGTIVASILETGMLRLPPEASAGTPLSIEAGPDSIVAIDKVRVDDTFDASGASDVQFATGQLFGSWVAGGTVAADISGNAATVTNGLYTNQFGANTILKADVSGSPYAFELPEGTLLGRPVGGTISAITIGSVISTLNLGNLIGSKAYIDHSILKADVAGQPISLVVQPNSVVGRVGSGDITCLTGAMILSMQQVNGVLPTGISGNASTVTNGIYTTNYTLDHSILVSAQPGQPSAITILPFTLFGRLGGDVTCLSASATLSFLQVSGALPSDISGNAHTVTNGLYVSDYTSAQSILVASAVSTPQAFVIQPYTIFGRLGSTVTCLTSAATLAFLQVAGLLPSSISGNAQTVTNGLYVTDYASSYTILTANVAAQPQPLQVLPGTLVGRSQSGDNITCLTPGVVLSMQQINGKLPTDISGNAATVSDGVYRHDYSADFSMLIASTAAQPSAFPILAQTVIGRLDNGVTCITSSGLLRFLQNADGLLGTSITGNAQTVTQGVYTSQFLANSLLKADAAGIPIAIVLPPSTVLGRLDDVIAPITGAQILALQQVNGLLPTNIAGNAATVTLGVYTSMYTAFSILRSDSAGSPASLALPTSTVVGRLSSGGIVALTGGQLLGLQQVGGLLPTSISGNAATVTNGVYSTMYADATILKADVAGTPVALQVTSMTVIGRLTGDITCLTASALLQFLQVNGKLPSDIAGNAETVSNGVYSTIFTDHSVIKADAAGNPIVLQVPPNTIVGRQLDTIACLTPAQLLVMQKINGTLPTDISGNAQTVTNGIYTTLLLEHSIIKADIAGQPIPLSVPTNTVVGRKLDGVVCLSPGDVLAMQQINGRLPTDISGNAQTVTNGIYSTMLVSYSIIKADVGGVPVALTVPVNTVVGRQGDGGIVCLTAAQLLALQQVAGALPTDITGNARTVTGGIYTTSYSLPYSILVSQSAGQPESLQVAPGTLIGRLAGNGGPVTCVTPAQILEAQKVDGKLPVDVSGSAAAVTNGVYTTDYDRDNCFLKADAAGAPVACVIPENTLIGRFGDQPIGPLTRDTVRRFLNESLSSFDTLYITTNDVTVISVLYSTTRIRVDGDDIASATLTCWLPNGPYNGFRKTLLAIDLAGKELHVVGRLFSPTMNDSTSTATLVFRKNYQSITLEWILDTEQWVCVHTEWADSSPQDDGYLGLIPEAATYRLSLVDNADGFVAYVPLANPNGSYAILVTDILNGGATASFLVSGSLTRGGHMVRTAGMAGSQGERLQMTWAAGSLPALSYLKRPSVGVGSIYTYNAFVMGVGSPGVSDAEMQRMPPTQYYHASQKVKLFDNDLSFNVPLSYMQPTGAFYVIVTDAQSQNGAQALYAISGSWATGGSVNLLSSAKGQTGEQLTLSWLAGSFPSLSFRRLPLVQTGSTLTYQVKVWGSASPDAQAVTQNTTALLSYVTLDATNTPVGDIATSTTSCNFLLFVCDVNDAEGAKAIFQIITTPGAGTNVVKLCQRPGTNGEAIDVIENTGSRPRVTVIQMQPQLSYRLKLLAF